MDANSMNSSVSSVSSSTAAAAQGASQGRKVVYVINERNGKSYWTRIGFGSLNKDGSMNLRIEAVPVGGGTIQVRDWEPRDDNRANDAQGSSPPARSAFI